MDGKRLRQTLFPLSEPEHQSTLMRRHREAHELNPGREPGPTHAHPGYMQSQAGFANQPGASVDNVGLFGAPSDIRHGPSLHSALSPVQVTQQDAESKNDRPSSPLSVQSHIVHPSPAYSTRSMFAHSKPRKSLRQRLDPVQDQDPPPYQSTFAFSESVRAPCGASLRRPDIPPRAQSRSASVMSSAYGRQEDDLSTIMMRGASDLRNAKFEIEEKRREIALLQSQLVTANKEKDEISQRLKAVKEAAQRSLQASCSR
ncbi:hypothetical protein PYCCODRAFT_131638 [Trametes coccinea BRFM310]|uniref:Uncharacterized protein n=1 Tax=Trametes coccinea (strain BRFM310) TaxID=1353009 RepID=A0A1Y2IU99_TRAC3|nr:hypothetical protein PYCCODRAFT_131638 [Trametes coccinea BRFM310]